MKTTYLLLIFLLFSFPSFTQESTWVKHYLDKVGIEFPTENVFEIDTVYQGLNFQQLYAIDGNTTFFIQKMPIVSKSSSLPNDRASLLDYYEKYLLGMSEGTNTKPKGAKAIQLGDVVGYRAVLSHQAGQDKEVNLFLLGKDIVTLIYAYSPSSPTDITKKEYFFNSLDLSQVDFLDQYTDKSVAYKSGRLLGKLLFYGFIGLGLFLVFKKVRKKN